MSESESEPESAESIAVVLPDGSELEVPEDATVEDCAYEIGPGLGRDTVAGNSTANWSPKRNPSPTASNSRSSPTAPRRICG